MKRVKRITSHVGHSRYQETLTADDGEDFPRTIGYITRPDIPSPYAYSPTHVVYHDPRYGNVIIVETAHKQYDVFQVGDTPMFPTDEAAEAEFIKQYRRARSMKVPTTRMLCIGCRAWALESEGFTVYDAVVCPSCTEAERDRVADDEQHEDAREEEFFLVRENSLECDMSRWRN